MSLKTIDKQVADWLGGDDSVYKDIFSYYYPKLLPACLKSVKFKSFHIPYLLFKEENIGKLCGY